MQTKEMKRSYISPVIKTVEYRPLHFFAASGGTEWHTGTDGQGDDNPVGPSQPDPNSDESRYLRQSMWEYE